MHSSQMSDKLQFVVIPDSTVVWEDGGGDPASYLRLPSDSTSRWTPLPSG